MRPTPAGDAGAGKQIYDRLGADRSQNEKVVSREEQPVDVRAGAAAVGVSGIARPKRFDPGRSRNAGAGQASNGWPVPPGTTAGAATAGGAASANEPRKIRTIPIRSDQLATAPPAEAPARNASGDAAGTSPAAAVATTAQRLHQPRTGRSRSIRRVERSTARQSRVRTAAAAVRAPEAAATGAYVVQIGRAQDAGRGVSRVPRRRKANIRMCLGGRKLLIRKKEIAGKGTFYGAQVGPFASRDDATQLCENLKSAGGTCIVQRN